MNALDIYYMGKRVQIHPGTDAWMMGDRYGTVVGSTKKLLKIKLDKSGRTIRHDPDDIELID